MCLRFVRHQLRQDAREPDRLRAEILPHRRPVPCVEDEVEDGEHGAHPLRQEVVWRHAKRDARVADLSLRAHETLRHRRLRNEERAGDLRRGQACERAQRQCDLRVHCQRGVAASEHQAEPFVRDHAHVVFLLGRQLREPGEQFRLPLERALASDPVASRREDPGAGIRGLAVAGPAGDRGRERILEGVLGEVEITEDVREDRERASPLLAEQRLDYACLASTGICMIGRTSIFPNRADGIFAAQCSASSSDSTSTR